MSIGGRKCTIVRFAPRLSPTRYVRAAVSARMSSGVKDTTQTSFAKKFKEVQPEDVPRTPAKVLCIDASSPDPSPMSKKDRKAARKTAKLASMPKVITTADIESVAKVLHPHNADKDEAEEERRLLEDPDIKLNLYFFKGTSNTREARRRHLKPKVKGEQEFVIEEDELAALLVSLGVPASDQVKPAQARQLVEQIRCAVRDDLVHVAKEHEQTMMRKAGFWRWASRKAYERLIQNGRLWDDNSDLGDIASRKDSVADTLEGLVMKENDSSGQKASQTLQISGPKTPIFAVRKNSGQDAFSMSPAIDDGWTQVGRITAKRKTETPTTSIKLSGNKGLAKLQVKPKGMFGAFSLADDGLVD
ncbi:hypothetical protein LTR86_001415 [Recurvomyces mirabilis]|nr:hypothetical protein LTR86_001415 [Recurvomyces mirabilis]